MGTADNQISKTAIRVIELILAALVLIGLVTHFSVTVHADDSVSPDGWKYSTEGSGADTYAVIKNYTGSNWNLKIPSKLGNYPVRKIGDYAFSDNNSVLSVVIPDTVTTIGDGAFRDCKYMTSVTLGKGLTSIGMYAFSGTGISQITFPNSVTAMGESVLSGCTSLKKIILPSKIKGIPTFFCNNTKITEIRIPEGVEYINQAAFYSCTSLEKVQLPKTLKEIYASAFDGDTNLKLIYPPEGLTDIGSQAFRDCKSLEMITLPSTLKYLNSEAFLGCTSLKTAVAKNTASTSTLFYSYSLGYNTKSTINTNLTIYCTGGSSASNYAESNGIKTASLSDAPKDPAEDLSLDPPAGGGTTPGGNTSGGSGTQKPLPAAKGSKIASKNASDPSVYQVIDASAAGPEVAFAGTSNKNASSITVPATVTDKKGVTYRVTKIAANAFRNNKKIKKLVVEAPVTEIGAKAFYGCKKLKTVKINGNALKKVGKSAFKKIKKNAKITIMIKNKKAWKKAVKLFKKSKPGKVKYSFKKKT